MKKTNFMDFNNKKIILGITGSIAAYKSPLLIREFIKLGAEVKVVATKAATEFVSMMVISNLTQHPVVIDIFNNAEQGNGAWHIELAHWCDAMVIAPCTATTLSKIANGICDSALSVVATALPADKPLIIAPAMDYTMYEHPTTQTNIKKLIDYGAKFIEPTEGELASGLVGKGRLPDNIEILQKVHGFLTKKLLLGKKVLITAGATQEKIDNVRYISNYSTGKMGFALAQVANDYGAEVTLIKGQTSINPPQVNNIINVTSAAEMFAAVEENMREQDIIIMSAAVSDFTPIDFSEKKIKKTELFGTNDEQAEYSIKTKQTIDILSWLGKNINKEKQYLVGFALETDNEIQNARKKLIEKNCDMIVLNLANKKDSGFGGDLNKVTLLMNDNEIENYSTNTKEKCAYAIINRIIEKSKN